jgi:hypothetical protein
LCILPSLYSNKKWQEDRVRKDLSAIVRLILGGELTEYTEMMGRARATATSRMVAQAAEMGKIYLHRVILQPYAG